MDISYTTNIHDLDEGKIRLLAAASILAYDAFSGGPVCSPVNATDGPMCDYECVDSWSGVNKLANHMLSIECYGLVYRSKQQPQRFIFAFRGTDSLTDGLLDADLLPQRFVSYHGNTYAGVEVESGFDNVYRSSTGTTASMQQQLFGLLQKHLPEGCGATLYITGHSLGAALSELFTLDVALCRPDLVASTVNLASPRVGNSAFVELYMMQPAQQEPATRTIRVQNSYDIVPCLPTEAMGYRSIPNALLLAFYWDGLFGKADLLSCHSALNYQAVIECAIGSSNGVCIDPAIFVPANDYYITSVMPDTTNVCSLWGEDAATLQKSSLDV